MVRQTKVATLLANSFLGRFIKATPLGEGDYALDITKASRAMERRWNRKFTERHPQPTRIYFECSVGTVYKYFDIPVEAVACIMRDFIRYAGIKDPLVGTAGDVVHIKGQHFYSARGFRDAINRFHETVTQLIDR